MNTKTHIGDKSWKANVTKQIQFLALLTADTCESNRERGVASVLVSHTDGGMASASQTSILDQQCIEPAVYYIKCICYIKCNVAYSHFITF